MSSNDPTERLDLDRGLPTTERDVAALRALRYPSLTDDDYLRFLAALEPSTYTALKAKPGPRGSAFRLSGRWRDS